MYFLSRVHTFPDRFGCLCRNVSSKTPKEKKHVSSKPKKALQPEDHNLSSLASKQQSAGHYNKSKIAKSMELALAECIPYSTESINVKQSSKLSPNVKLEAKQVNSSSKIQETRKVRRNEFGIQMLPTKLHNHLFGNSSVSKGPTEAQVTNSRLDLSKHGLLSKDETVLDEIDITIPPLQGGSIEEHFRIIAEQQSTPYRHLLQSLLTNLPTPPTTWSQEPGWTCYHPQPHAVDYPPDNALIFDVEVCVTVGEMPTLATAASPNAWYSWVSPILASGGSPGVEHHYTTKDFIPLESSPSKSGVDHGLNQPRVVVGHNVSYDRVRVKEQYWLSGTALRFIDTMSMHICVGGVTSYQRSVLKSKADEIPGEEWRNVSSLNSLSEVHNLYCGSTLDKETRNVFVVGDMDEIRNRFQELMTYCAGDVSATHRVLLQLLPLFIERFPHPVTLAGMLELGTAYLPVNASWTRYKSDSNQTYADLDSEGRFILSRKADEACRLLHNEQYKQDLWMWDQDWSVQDLKLKKTIPKSTSAKAKELKSTELSESDMSESAEGEIKTVDITSLVLKNQREEKKYYDEEMTTLDEKFSYLESSRAYLPARMPHLPGYPAWYRKLCARMNTEDWSPGPQMVSTSMQIAPKLLRLTWESYPLHFIRGHGWGFLVPYGSESDVELPIKQLIEKCRMAGPNESEAALGTLHKDVQESLARREYGKRKSADNGTPTWYHGTGVWCNVDIGGCCWFLKLPHKDGPQNRVGNPLAKDFLNKFSENVLAGSDLGAEKVLAIGRQLSYWRNNRERVEKQVVVWLSDTELPKGLRGSSYGAIIPLIVVCGTLTRRAVEATWMTASNAHKERVGSELRAMIMAPKGFSIVGADVDSQELWIASVIGDAHHAKAHGATPLGWMTLSGKKAEKTDMHSVTAKAVGISRDHAKVINYARIYGAGQSFAERLLKQFNPAMSQSEAKSKASKMFMMTKGKRMYRLKESYREALPDRSYSMYEALKLRSQHGVGIDDMFEPAKWVGGTESAMFNRLEEIARLPSPSTPFLGGRLSRSLEPSISDDQRFLPTRVNWVVQSGAVDFLHLMLVCMKWLEPDVRFCLSFHDEVRYLVPSAVRYRVALALHVTNLMARSFCASRLGLNDLPLSVAFFSSVEVDTVLRKEADHDCVTPSNPHGLERGYGVPLGETLDIRQTVAKAGNALHVK